MTCAHCCPRWRGLLPILGMLAVVLCAAAVAFQCGRHLNPQTRIVMLTQPIRVTIVEAPVGPTEPNHQGTRR